MLRKVQKETTQIFRIILIGWAIILNIYHLNIGLADNGDWGRTILWFSDRPQNFSEFWPTDPLEYDRRFFKQWIPEWNVNFEFQKTFSSTLLIWFPGVFLNTLLFSKSTLFIPIVSVVPRIVIIFVLIYLLDFFDKNSKFPFLFYVICGVPFVLLISTTDYLVYLNSFYQELGTLIYLLILFIVSLQIISTRNININKGSILFFLLCLIALSKTNNFYWPTLYLFAIFYVKDKIEIILPRIVILLVIPFIIISSLGSVLVTRLPSSISYTKYHAIFYGALTFSNKPQYHLTKLGYDQEAIYCIGQSGFHNQSCYERYKNNTSFIGLMAIYIDEPAVFVKSLVFTASNMQNLSIDYLGKYKEGDQIEYRKLRLNLWSEIKKQLFPRGTFLLLFLVLIIFLLILFLKRWGNNTLDFSFSFMSTIYFTACLLEMIIAIIGDGRQEIIKHLFAANLCFDLGIISFFGLVTSKVITLYFSNLNTNL